MDTEHIKSFIKSTLFTKILCAIGIVIVALLILQIGISIGYRKAAFSYGLGNTYYYRTFGGQGGMMFEEEMPGGYGAVGKIIEVSLPRVMVEGRDNIEKDVLVDDDTIIRKFRGVIPANDLKTNDMIVVIGSPNGRGQINARIIRLIPPFFEASTSGIAK